MLRDLGIVLFRRFEYTVLHISTAKIDFVYFFDDWNYGYVHLQAKIGFLRRVYNKLVKRV